MKVRIEENKSMGQIPEVGEIWKHKGAVSIYMRINDSQGRWAIEGSGFRCKENIFFSINLENGRVCTSSYEDYDIEILTPSKVDEDGTIVFTQRR